MHHRRASTPPRHPRPCRSASPRRRPRSARGRRRGRATPPSRRRRPTARRSRRAPGMQPRRAPRSTSAAPAAMSRRARPSTRTLFRRGRREVELEFQAVDADGVRDALDAHSAAILISEAVHLAGHQDDAVARQHLARARQRAEPGREVQSAAAEAVLCLHRFSRLEPDPHPHRQRGVLPDRVGEALLQGDRRAKSLAGRVEHAKRFVTSQLHRPAAAGADDLSRQLREAGRQPRSLLVSSLARERRVAADVRDQECADACRAGWIVYSQAGADLSTGCVAGFV